MDCNTPGFPVHFLELAQTHVHWISDSIQPSHPLLSPFPLAFNLSQHQSLFQWVSSLHQVAKYGSFSFSISPFSKCSALISFRNDWFDLLAVQGTLMSLLQHHRLKASVLQCSSFFMVQLSQLYKTTGKTIALTIWILGLPLVAQLVKNPPTMQDTWIQFLDLEDPLEEVTATHSNILAWRIPWMEEPGGLQSMGLQRVRHNWAISLSLFKIIVDGDCSHEIKRHLLLGRKAMTSLESVFKSINSSALSFLHSPTLTSIHYHRKNHSID